MVKLNVCHGILKFIVPRRFTLHAARHDTARMNGNRAIARVVSQALPTISTVPCGEIIVVKLDNSERVI